MKCWVFPIFLSGEEGAERATDVVDKGDQFVENGFWRAGHYHPVQAVLASYFAVRNLGRRLENALHVEGFHVFHDVVVVPAICGIWTSQVISGFLIGIGDQDRAGDSPVVAISWAASVFATNCILFPVGFSVNWWNEVSADDAPPFLTSLTCAAGRRAHH
ncbi:hypothetical protein D3C81_1527990 [compost metagenome]